MSQDIVSDALNQIMNAKKSHKDSLVLTKSSKLLLKILEIAKQEGYIEYKEEGRKIIVNINKLNEFKAIKPRFTVSKDKINHYVRRYLPARDFGFLIISTNKGLMKSNEAEEKNLGGCLIAYVY